MTRCKTDWVALVLAGAMTGACGSSGSTGDGDGDGSGPLSHPTGSPATIALSTMGSCVIYDSSQLWCWGWNQNGQFGTHRDTQFETPAHIYELGDVKHMALAGDFGCAVLASGAVECMGYDHGGTDQKVALGGSAVQVAAGSQHACALLTGGTVECWGSGNQGQLGDGGQQGRENGAPVNRLSDVVAIAAARDRSCALDSAGTIWCWGDRLDDSGDPRLEPEAIGGIAAAVAFSAGDNMTCALHADKTVSCWGVGACNSLVGDPFCAQPFSVSQLPAPVDDIRAGNTFGCARSGGELRCWGRNLHGQLGDGTLNENLNPTVVDGLSAVTMVGVAKNHVCAVVASDEIYCWGGNGNGQIGIGNTIDQLTPANVGL